MSAKGNRKKIKPNSVYLDNFLKTNESPEDNREYVMFHGTTKKAAEEIKMNGFKTPGEDINTLGAGVYVTRDIVKACKYPHDVRPSQRRVLKLRVNVGRVLKIDKHGHDMHTKHEYDTAWVPPDVDMAESNNLESCVYDPKKIRVMEVMKVKEKNISKYRHLQSGLSAEDRKTYVMYHGTLKKNALQIQRNGFIPSTKGMLGAGVYLSRDIQKVIKYPLETLDSEKMVLKVKVNVGKVKVIDKQRHYMQYNWHTKYGFDTAWVPPDVGMVESEQEEDCVYDPKRIKVLTMLKVSTLKMLNPSL